METERLSAHHDLEQLFREHAADIHRLAYRITGSASDADDIVQDLFVGLPEALRSFRGSGSLQGWLRRIAARMALARLRRKPSTELPDDLAAASLDEDAPFQRAAINLALATLPDSLRVVFMLREVEGYSHADIAQLLGITAASSEVRLHRAKKQLRNQLKTYRQDAT